MPAERYISIECRNETECSSIIRDLRIRGISCSVVKTGPLTYAEHFLAYFSTDEHLNYIRCMLDKYRLIHNDVVYMSPKQQSCMR